MKIRQRLRRWHIWLGWIVGLPFLAWTISGLVMVARPIETVRGEDLIAEAPPLPPGLAPVAPVIGPRPLASLRLEPRPDGAKGCSNMPTAAPGSPTAPPAACFRRWAPPTPPGSSRRATPARRGSRQSTALRLRRRRSTFAARWRPGG